MKIPKVENLIFDLDGVLADTDKARFKLLTEILKDYGINLPEAATIKDLEGISTRKFLERILPNLEEHFDEIIKKRHKLYLERLEEFCIPFPGMKETITDLSVKYRLFVATTNARDIALQLLEHLGISDKFQEILGREITEDENKTKNYGKVLQYLDLKPDNAIVIEDSLVGVTAAKKAGIFCIAFNHFNNQQINQLADIVVKDYRELRELLLE